MSSKTNVLIEIQDLSLKNQVASLLAADWSIPWNICDLSRNPDSAADALIAVIDDEASAIPGLPQSSSTILLGLPQDPSKFFAVVETQDPEEIFKSIKRAYSYQEIIRQNMEAIYCKFDDGSSLESVAQALSIRIHQLVKLSEMRVELVDQMPVGVLGVDDESNIVLANPKAIQLLGMEDIPIWGLSVSALLKDKVAKFIADKDAEEISISRYGQRLLIRKSSFILEKKAAGTILILWKPSASESP